MSPVLFDPMLPDDQRREALFAGDLLVFSSGRAATALCAFARGMLEEAFRPLDP